MKLTLKQLSVFTAIARLKRVTKAANELCLTQSAASQSLKELETILGYQLFNRVGRELLINEHGQGVLPKALQMLDLQAQLLQPDLVEVLGTLNIIASVTIGSYLMPQIIADFIKQYPLVEIKLSIANSAEVIEQLEQGQAHIGLIETNMNHPGLDIKPWHLDQLVVFSHIDYALPINKKLSLSQLAEQNWILREHGSGTRAVFVAAMQQQGLHISKSMELTRQEAIKQAVKAQLGVGVLSQLAIKQELDYGLFKLLKTPLNLNRQFSIVATKHYAYHKATNTFQQFLQNTPLV